MSIYRFLSENLAATWAGEDFETFCDTLERVRNLQAMAIADDPEFLDVIRLVHRIRIDSEQKTTDQAQASLQRCKELKAEILYEAARANPDLTALALAALREGQRWSEAASLIPAAETRPDFSTIAEEASLILCAAGETDRALSLLYDRLTPQNGDMTLVHSLVKIVLLTDKADWSLRRLQETLASAETLQPWRIAYFVELGLAMSQDALVESTILALHARHGAKSILNLALAALKLEAFDLMSALGLLRQERDGTVLFDWEAALVAKLHRLTEISLKSQEWAALKGRAGAAGKPRVALTLSGFVRHYDAISNILDFLLRHGEDWDIEIFAQAFDRLGNIRTFPNLPKSICDFGHGGFYREINKTRLLASDRVRQWLSPLVMQVDQRLEDGHYRACLGMEHPQWQAVWEAYALFARHQTKTWRPYRYVIRGRYDVPYDRLDLNRLDLADRQIACPSNEVYGTKSYRMNDRLAIGSPESMRVYCSIGDGRNFKSVEDFDEWKRTSLGYEYNHESHLALWLTLHGIGITLPDWLTV